ncbi:MAG: lantibiotic dehydratase family protein, partial [Acidobacteriota bacterium]|nr:lantibiotic dehydratase family protein [Acidobacteriota bacterium]
EAEFGGARAGWRLARYHSPDVMIAADGAEAVARGDFKLVLGEFHLSTNTLRASFFVNQHPRPEELFRAVELDLPGVGASPVPPKSWPKLTSRTFNVLTPHADYKIEVAPDSLSNAGAERTLRIADLLVEDSPRGLQIRSRDRTLSFDILDVFADLLTSQAINYMKIVAPARHTPRVEVDRVVLAREAWRLTGAELPFAALAAEAERFAGARRLARRLGLPRHVFVKSPSETKPFFVDFESPALVGLLCRAARGLGEGAELGVSEMLPGVEQLWLEDGEGGRYTSELRLVALDLAS